MEIHKHNLGCGMDLRAGWTNADVVDYGGNQIMDLNRFPYPFPNNHFDEILYSQVLEHL